jgi:predicted O-methyltransferase YrrM
LKSLLVKVLPLADLLLAPIVYLVAYLFKAIRRAGIWRMPLCKLALIHVGVFPIINHYYEPLFDSRLLRLPLDQNRVLPGIDWNTAEQLHLLKSFCFNDELEEVLRVKIDDLTFNINNDSFLSGDAEYLYNLIRLKKPTKIIEIGSGNSTLMAIKAITKNQEEIVGYECKLVCIEPYEMPWLEKTGVTIIRQRVEEVNKAMFSALEKDDILFIDSSHIIRPQGDVLFEYLELIPSLKPGVIVHVHDIFSPKDYLKEWVVDKVIFWNEQYLLEAFLTCNHDWKVIGALNYLHHNYYQDLRATCPFLTRDREPGSFYIQKTA